MAIELVRMVWCDICLKKDKVQTPGQENCATVVDGNRMKQIDLCEVHRKELAFDDIIEYGNFVEKPLNTSSSLGRRRKPSVDNREYTEDGYIAKSTETMTSGGNPRSPNRPIGSCSACGKIIAIQALKLHNVGHKRRGERQGKIIPME